MPKPKSPAEQSGNILSEPVSNIAIRKIVSHLNSIVRTSADELPRYSEQPEFRKSIRPPIPQIISPLSDSDQDVHKAGADAFVKLSEEADLRDSIRLAIPQIIALLSDSNLSICRAGADALVKLSEHAELRQSIRSAIPQIIALLSDSEGVVHLTGAVVLAELSKQADFRESIRPAILQIIALLSDSQGDVREAGASALAKLSEQAEFRESIRPSIPQIIALLSDSDLFVRRAGADALVKLSEQAKLRQSIRPAIPQIIALLSHSKGDVRESGAKALAKLLEQPEFRESIAPAIPQFIGLLSESQWDVCKASADALAKLSKQAELRQLIRPAIPQIITLLSDSNSFVREAGAAALVELSEQAEFRESIRPAIPQIIAFLSDSKGDVREVGANALAKLSEQPEFRESIAPAIPQFIDLLRESRLNVRKAGADALAKLSEQPEFQESIVPAIPQVIGLLSERRMDVRQARVDSLLKLLEQAEVRGTISPVVPPISGALNNSQLCHFETTTCWIAAEHALQHAKSKMSSVSKVFDKWNIQESQYVVHAGFDESLINSGVGYLEQIHIFISAEVQATSPLLSELGRIFSPFSSILFTESSSYHIPVFKDDGNVWEFDELIYFTASKFADGGSSAKTPLSVISLSQTPPLADGTTGFSQRGSSSGEEEKNEKRKSEKGKERDRGDGDEGDKGDANDKDPDDDPEEPSGDRRGTIAGPAKIFFEIGSKIYPIQDKQNAFQKLTMQGSLTIQTTALVQSPRQFSKRHVQFTELIFGTEPTTDIAYEQFHVRIVVDSQQENARVEVIKPKRTPKSDGEENQSSSTKTGRTRGVTAGVIVGPHPQGAITTTVMKTNEETAGSEKKRYTSRITEQRSDGVVQWGFNVDDDNLQERGIDMRDDILPTAHFEFFGDSNIPAPPPERMDIVIASYWSMILPSEPKSTWIRKLLRLFRSSGNTQTPSYSNLFQIVAFKTVPSDLPELSYYKAMVKVRSGANDPPVVKRPADSIDVTPVVFDDLQRLSTLNLPTIAKFKLSDNCIRLLENLGSDSKATSFIQ